MIKRGMDDRGQLSAEYLLLIVAVLVILGTVTMPLVGKSVDASNDVSDVSAASNAVNSIANAANLVYANGPGSKRTLQVDIPSDVIVTLNDSGAFANVSLSNGSYKIVSAPTNFKLQPNTYLILNGTHTVTIWWPRSDWRILNTITNIKYLS